MNTLILCLFVFAGNVFFFKPVVPNLSLLGSSVVGVALFSVLVFIAFRTMRLSSFSTSLRLPHRAQLYVAIIAVIALFPVALVSRFIDPTYDVGFVQQNGLSTVSGALLFLCALPLLVVREELFFRFFQQAFSLRLGAALSVFAVALNSAILHVPLGGQSAWNVFFSVLLGSLVMAFVYVKTQNLWASFFAHVVYDILLLGQILLHVHAASFEWMFWAIFALIFFFALRRIVSVMNIANEHKSTPLSFQGVLLLGVAVLVPLGVRWVVG